MKIISLYQFETTNVGDLNCSPCQYFDYGDVEKHNITRDDAPPVADAYIVGGGGAPRTMRYTLPGIKIAWGIGATHRREQFMDFDLVGTRDTDLIKGTEWVPCASCMSPLFDNDYPITMDIVRYSNTQYPVIDGINNRCTMEEALCFLGSAEIVVTDSYHGAYWATLLGRKVITTRPDKPKLSRFMHPPATGFTQILRAYPEALEECRDANTAFDKKVRKLLNG